MKLDFSTLPLAKGRFIEPMYARLVNELPEGKDWLYEVKFDGYRCLAGRDSTGVTLWSRRGNLFTTQFPQSRFDKSTVQAEQMKGGRCGSFNRLRGG
jgi:ATP-dependent DNA ligase